MNIKEEVNKINSEIWEKGGVDYENMYLRYIEDNTVESVYLVINNLNLEFYIWDSENNPLEWIESKNDYEDFRVLLKREIGNAVKELNKFKNIIK